VLSSCHSVLFGPYRLIVWGVRVATLGQSLSSRFTSSEFCQKSVKYCQVPGLDHMGVTTAEPVQPAVLAAIWNALHYGGRPRPHYWAATGDGPWVRRPAHCVQKGLTQDVRDVRLSPANINVALPGSVLVRNGWA
jgi:hypothetical protein